MPPLVMPPLVVLVHGTMDRSSSFARVLRHLDGLDAITYDRRGYASANARPPASTIDDHVDDLLDVIDGRPAVVAGHSFGGTVALAAALRRPDLIVAAGAFEPPLPWMPWWPEGSASTAVGERAPGDAAEWFFRRVVGDRMWERLPPSTRAQRRAEGPALLADMQALRRRPAPFTVDDLSASGVPMAIASGTESKPHQRESARQLAELTGFDLTRIDGAAHGGHRSHPREFAQWVRGLGIRSIAGPAI